MQARKVIDLRVDPWCEDDPRRVDTANLGFPAQTVGSRLAWLAQPQTAIRRPQQYPAPEVENLRIELVAVVERTEDEALARQAGIAPRRWHSRSDRTIDREVAAGKMRKCLGIETFMLQGRDHRVGEKIISQLRVCLLYTSPSPRD